MSNTVKDIKARYAPFMDYDPLLINVASSDMKALFDSFDQAAFEATALHNDVATLRRTIADRDDALVYGERRESYYVKTIEKLNRRVADRDADRDADLQKESSLKADVVKLERTVADRDAELSRADAELAAMRDRVSLLETQLSACAHHRNALATTLDGLRKERVQLQDENCKQGVQIEQLQSALRKANARNAGLVERSVSATREGLSVHYRGGPVHLITVTRLLRHGSLHLDIKGVVPKKAATEGDSAVKPGVSPYWPTPTQSPTGRNPSSPKLTLHQVKTDGCADEAAEWAKLAAFITHMYGEPIIVQPRRVQLHRDMRWR